jgi:DNA-binding transcriptional MerR regulator
MSDTHDSFDLNELAYEAGVTPRTIRYYVQQGLLPSPGTRGPGARYDRGHLDRLTLIKLLQRQHLPLAEIRRQLEELDDAGVRMALSAVPDAEPRRGSALEYVRERLARYEGRPGQGVPSEGSTMFPTARLLRDPESVKPSKPAARSTWERIPLAPDVELHVRRPLSREQNRFVERLLEAARHLSPEEP